MASGQKDHVDEVIDGISNSEEKKLKKEDDLKVLKDYIAELEERLKLKNKLLEKNLKASDNRPEDSFFSKLDSSLKKNTAFVKKLKGISESQKESIITDFNKLNLTKYIGEISSALVEAKLKMADINAVLVVASLIHQRYVDFAPNFLDQWQKLLKTKRDEKVQNQSKLRVDLRLFAELLSIGLFPEKEALNLLAGQLNQLTNNDKSAFNNVNIVISFCKHCGDDYAGLVPRKMKLLSEEFNIAVPRREFLKPERQKPCRQMMKDYCLSLQEFVLKHCKDLRNEKKCNKKIIQTKGELSKERKEKQEQMEQTFEKLLGNCAILCDLLDEPGVELPEEDTSQDEDQEMFFDVYHPSRGADGGEDGDGLFEDEETRQFYEMIPDLKSLIPMILYKDSEQPTVNSAEETVPCEEDLELREEEVLEGTKGEGPSDEEVAGDAAKMEEDPELAAEAEVDDDTNVAPSSKLLLESFLNDLPNCINRELIDNAAINFCTNLNTKGNRNKLVKTLFLVHRNRCDLLPFYSRLVATLHPCMPSLSSDLVTMLKKDFRFRLKKKDQINLESKLKIVRFIGELVKFKMFSKNDALYCLKLLITDFKHHCIEMACGLLDTCGRFLYRSAESHHRMQLFLDVMMRKKTALAMDSRYMMMIDNAFYYSRPPEAGSQEQQEPLPVVYQFIRRLICKVLNKKNVEEVVKIVRKINWDDLELKSFVVQCLTRVWLVKYNHIQCCAKFLAFLAIDRNEVAVHVVDAVMESIKAALETNDPKQRQQRVAIVKYLGELYNYRMVESEEIFNTLYLFVNFNTSYDELNPHPLDPPEHLLRIRLVCTLLQTCGDYFHRGLSMRKLDCFLVYFQRYYWFKKSSPVWSEEVPFPISVTNEVDDLFEFLRPELVQCKCFFEANQAAQKLDEEQKKKIMKYLKLVDEQGKTSAPLSTIQESASEGEDGDGDRDDGESRMKERDDSSDNESGSESDSSDDSSFSDKNSQAVSSGSHLKAPLLEECPEEESHFIDEFEKILADSIKQREQDLVKVATVDISVPLGTRKLLNQTDAVVAGTPVNNNNSGAPTMPFVILNKKGNKQQYSRIDIPVNESLASRISEHQKRVEEEKGRMKEKVLKMHHMQEQESYREELEAMKTQLQRQFTSSSVYKRKPVQTPKTVPSAETVFGKE